MRPALLLPVVLTLGACSPPLALVGGGGAVPAVEAEPPPPVEVAAPAPDATLPTASVEAFEPVEAPPLGAPRGTVERRSVYPDPGVSEWTLTGGLTVVYKQVESADGVAALAFAPGVPAAAPSGSATGRGALRALAGLGERQLVGTFPDLPAALRAVAGAQRTAADFGAVVLVGPAPPDAAEAEVGARLGRLRPGTPAGADAERPAPHPAAWTDVWAPGTRREAAALEVLAGAVAERAGAPVEPFVGPAGRRLGLAVAADVDLAGLLAPFSEAEVARSRRAALDPPPALWAARLADLYRERGERRPARDPAEADRRGALAAAVTSPSVNALAERLLQALGRDSPDQ
jgi:hypothetical protein